MAGWKGTPGFSKGESWIPAGTRGTPGSRSCRRVPLDSDVNFQLKQWNRGFWFFASRLIWILASSRGTAGFSVGQGKPGIQLDSRSVRGSTGSCRSRERTEAAIKTPIAAPAWPRYGTRPQLRHLCVLRTVRAAGGGFRRRRGALRAGRCTLGRLFGLTDAARPRTWRYALAQ